MNSFSRSGLKLIQVLTAFLMLSGLIFPPTAVAYAQDVVPPSPGETGGEAPPAEPPAEAPPSEPAPPEAPPAAEMPPQQTVEAPPDPEPTAAPVEESLPLEQTVEVPLELPTEALTLPIELPAEAATLPTEAATLPVDLPTEAAPISETAEEASPTETIAEIVEVLDETNTVLVDENNEEIPLSSEQAVEVLENADPFFKSGSTYIGYTSVSGSCPSFVSVCNHVDNPVTAALGDPLLTDSTTLYIEGSNSAGGKLYNESVTIDKNINLQAGRNFTRYGGNIHFDDATAVINQITLAANLGNINNVFANSIFVNGAGASSDNVRGSMLDDALAMIAENGDITLSAGTYKDDNDGFRIATDGVSLEGAGDQTIIDGQGSYGGNGIEVDGDHVTIKKIKVIGSYDGIDIDSGDDVRMENITLTGNHIGLHIQENADLIRINNSNIFGNSNWGLFTESSGVNAENNYWGHPDGPTLCGGSSSHPTCGTQKGDAIWYWMNVDVDPIKTAMICPQGMQAVDGVCMVVEADCEPGYNDIDHDGECESSGCPNGFGDANNDGNCEYSNCDNGWTDTDHNGICEPSGCEPGMTDYNHDNVCELSDCLAGEHDINSDGICEPSACPNGFTDVNHDGVCEFSNCANGWTDMNHDGVCESSGCENGWTDINQDGTCESSNCNNGFTDVDHDNVCETSGCLPGMTDYDHNATCETSTCQPGEHDVNSDGICEPSTCTNGFTDVNFDGVCESSGCLPGTTDYDHNGSCEASLCQAGEHDVNSDGVCEPSTCANGFTDVNFDGVCESSGCTNGNTDFDHNGTCESSGCLAGTNDMDCNGICSSTFCAMNTFDENADGGCEPTICAPGFSDKDSDGTCAPTFCAQGTNDTDSDGLCEDDVLDEELLNPAGLFGAFAVAGSNTIIPVTGGVSKLSCTAANTLVLENGSSVSFSAPLCGYEAGLNEASAEGLPAPLPSDAAFAGGFSLTVQKESNAAEVLPSPVTNTLSFMIPEDLKDKTFVILFWDPAAKEGLGDWVEIPAKILKDGVVVAAPLTDGDERQVISGVEISAVPAGVTTVNFTGTFVLAYK